jgi:Putative DNA-binding domain
MNGPDDAAHQRERLRQQMLLRTLLRDTPPDSLQGWLRESAHRARRALDAYTANAGASAERALSATFPVVRALLGEESFAQLARAYWHAFSPVRGDLAWLGESLSVFIEKADQLADEPYLADCARLEWLLARAEVASDATPQTQTLALLAQLDPEAIGIELAPGCAVLASKHPIVTIWQAHQSNDGDRQGGADPFAAVRTAFAEARRESAWVWRDGWRARASHIDEPGLLFMQALLGGASVGKALLAGGASFDFEAWLVIALERGNLRRVFALQA